MKKIIYSLLLIVGFYILSCGDPSKEYGKDAAEEQNQNSTAGSYTKEKGDTVFSDDGKIKGSGSEPANSPPY
jgi:hypothetical protein